MTKGKQPKIGGNERWVFHETVQAHIYRITAQAIDMVIEKIAQHFDDWAEYDKNEYWPPTRVAKEIRKFQWWIAPEEKL